MYLLILLFFTGCATSPSIDDLRFELALCANAQGDCAEIQAKLKHSLRLQEMRNNAKTPCPPGYIALCEDRQNGCRRRYANKPVKYTCITREQFRGIFRWY